MTRLLGGLAAIAILAACSDRPAETPTRAYAHFMDRLRAATGGIAGWPRDRGEAERLSTEACYRMTPPQRMRGVWIDEFEDSRFLPGAGAASADGRSSPRIWLDTQSRGIIRLARPREGERHVWLIDFIGVQTEHAGGYGHLNSSDHIVVVQRVTGMRLMELRRFRPPSG